MSVPIGSGDYLNPGEYSEEFDRLWSRLTATFVKVERLQTYSRVGSKSYEAYLAGRVDEALQIFRSDVIGSEAELLADIPRKGICYTRIRIVEPPLSTYLRFEFETYRISAEYGQVILVLNADGSRIDSAPEFILFDRYAALVLDYSDDGELRGAWRHESAHAIDYLFNLFLYLRRHSVSLGAYHDAGARG